MSKQNIKKICVFCGSSKGNNALYEEAAEALGTTLAQENIGLVYGGGRVGLMGIVAQSVMRNGGTATGIIPHFLNEKEGIAFNAISEVLLVDSMHERKLKMHQLSDGVIALPGGFGTLDEIFEILCWAQLGLHTQPVGLLNINGYWQPLLDLLRHVVTQGFADASLLDFVTCVDDVAGLQAALRNALPEPA